MQTSPLLSLVLPMPKKLILLLLIFLLISLYLVVVADMYLLPSEKQEDIITNIQILDSQKHSKATHNDIIYTQAGEKLAVLADTSIVFEKAVPVTNYYSSLLHKPLSVDFAQDGTIQHIDTLYLSQSYNIYFALFLLACIQIFYLLRWSKNSNIKDVYLYLFILLFALLLGFQYFR